MLFRWVKQKGIDIIADITPWILNSFPRAQLILLGPASDIHGQYARIRLTKLAGEVATGMHPSWSGRLFVKAEFVSIPKELQLSADFCFMPSRSEPFGSVYFDDGLN